MSPPDPDNPRQDDDTPAAAELSDGAAVPASTRGVSPAEHALLFELPDSVDRGEPKAAPPLDPWAHRRGEPRLFAFFWSMYLLLTVAGSVTWVASTSQLTPDSYAPAARIMLIVVAVGATILWPMTRLSQATPKGSVLLAVLADLLVMLVPMQMVVWPLVVLAHWPAGIVACVALLLSSWTLLTGGVLALALCGRRVTNPGANGVGWRSIWMFAFLAMALAAPVIMLLRSSSSSTSNPLIEAATVRWPTWLPMLSPITAVSQLTGRGLLGPQRPVSPMEWALIGWVAIAGVWFWILAGVREGFARLADPA